jgi:hypothetical protein
MALTAALGSQCLQSYLKPLAAKTLPVARKQQATRSFYFDNERNGIS